MGNDEDFKKDDLKCCGNCFYFDINVDLKDLIEEIKEIKEYKEGQEKLFDKFDKFDVFVCKCVECKLYDFKGVCSKWIWDKQTNFLRRSL